MNFTEQWIRSSLGDEGTRGAEILHSVSWSYPMSQTDTIIRLICHVYVSRMPPRGLQELHETLRDMIEFYNELPLKEQVFLPQPVGIKAKITSRVVRPDFSIDYDEE